MHKQTHKRAFYTLAGCIAALALCVAASLFLLAPAPKAQDVTIPGTRGDIYATVQLPGKLARGEELPLVVLCHGFTGNRQLDGHAKPLAAAAATATLRRWPPIWPPRALRRCGWIFPVAATAPSRSRPTRCPT